MHPQAQQLADAFIAEFWAADHSVKWLAAETERIRWLDHQTVLIGTIDALGETEDGRRFFADWKTISAMRARNMEQVKAEWRFDPQALTYAVLMGGDMSDFTVRWAVKDKVPRFDFEWYTYSAAEIHWWHGELRRIAGDIRAWRVSTTKSNPNWPVNPNYCTRFGWAYRCPLYDQGCPKLNFEFDPGLPPRDHHLDTELMIRKAATESDWKTLVFLNSSAVETWLGCHEKYRRFYEGKGLTETSDALTIGFDFHALVAEHIKGLING